MQCNSECWTIAGTIASFLGATFAAIAIFIAYSQLKKSRNIASQDLFINCVEQLRSRFCEYFKLVELSASFNEKERLLREGEALNTIESICCIYFDDAFNSRQKKEIESLLLNLIAMLDVAHNIRERIELMVHEEDTFNNIILFLNKNEEKWSKAKDRIKSLSRSSENRA